MNDSLRRFCCVVIFCAGSMSAVAQKVNLSGHVRDTTGNALSPATVMLLLSRDSSLVNFSATDSRGNFMFKNVSTGEYLLRITFVGYRTHTETVAVNAGAAAVELAPVVMEAVSQELDAVVVQGEKPPVVIKKDTIEFNAGSFKTQENANVEALLKKLPGVEVDNEGNITAQGEQVRQVMVDGKSFFGNDPKIATRNLPADAIDKVQIFDRKSDQAAFTGIDDGDRQKTINLELKEEKRKGAFGNVTAGIGTDERATAKVSLNKFSRTRQLSLLGLGNNINEQGFSIDDYMNFTGGSRQMMGGGGMRMTFSSDNASGVPLNFGNRANGVMTNAAGGLNFNNEFNRKTELSSNYFYNYLDHDLLQETYRANFLPAGSFTYSEEARQNSTNDNHRLNAILDHKIDSANSLRLTTAFTHNQTSSRQESVGESRRPDHGLQNESERLSLANGTVSNLNASLLFRHKFARKGRTFSANFTTSVRQTDQNGSLDARNVYYADDIAEEELIRQRNTQLSDNQSYGANFSYTEPLGGRKYLEASYQYNMNLNDVDRRVFDVSNGQETMNEMLSNAFTSDYRYQRAGLNVKVNRSQYSLTLGGHYQFTTLTGNLKLVDETIRNSFRQFLPSARFTYDLSNNRHVRFDYETFMQEPSIQELQPVVDNSDPLNIYVGNPALQPSFRHNWRLNFNSFDPGKFISFFAFINASYTANAIVNSRTTDEQLRTVTMPVNVGYSSSMNADANFSFPVTKLRSRISVGGNVRETRSITLLNDQANNIVQHVVGPQVRYDFRYKEIFDLNLSARLSRQRTVYEFDQPDQVFLNQTYSAESNLSFLRNYQLNASVEYLVYNNEGTGFHQVIPLLNMAFSRFVMKNKTGEVRLSVNNLLDRALGVSQSASINYLERTTTNSLGRYVMLSFVYSINKQLNPLGMRPPGGRMMRIIRD